MWPPKISVGASDCVSCPISNFDHVPDYRMPTALDVPPIECVIIETPVPGVHLRCARCRGSADRAARRGHSQRHRARHRCPHPADAHDSRAGASRAPRLMQLQEAAPQPPMLPGLAMNAAICCRYCAVQPPSRVRIEPVAKRLSSLARNRMPAAISSGAPSRPINCRCSSPWRIAAASGLLAKISEK